MDDLDCVTCGACCVSDYNAVDYVHLTDFDLDQLTDEDHRLLVYVEDGFGKPLCSIKTVTDSHGNCRCKALRGEVGDRVSCSIYEQRPTVCRQFSPGSSECSAAREQMFGVSDGEGTCQTRIAANLNE